MWRRRPEKNGGDLEERDDVTSHIFLTKSGNARCQFFNGYNLAKILGLWINLAGSVIFFKYIYTLWMIADATLDPLF